MTPFNRPALALAVAASLAGAGLTPAVAQIARPEMAKLPVGALVQDVQWRRHHHHHGGAGIAAGIAAGAIIGGLIAGSRPYYYGPGYYYGGYAPPPAYYGDAVGYCMRRFRSYDPASGTYLGYDGYRHPCP